MYHWIWVTVAFCILAIWVWRYDPPMMDDYGNVTPLPSNEGRARTGERFRLIIALVILWAIAMGIMYHEVVWKFLRQIFSF